jgi:hypothetical protein
MLELLMAFRLRDLKPAVLFEFLDDVAAIQDRARFL